ncbi:YIEGIA family protein [Effusibacillus pohliae]|uniref:YIEGIA family protein n=1 Tax=Effusibacillus pohliae TaxID=232270 RepID=UPI000368D683|nr:YIEGIA family protein [Effusibacillus pohliae]
MNLYTKMILVGTILGVIARLYMLRTDYRQYPTYPHGRVIHIALGVIASGLGAVAVPALIQKNYTAVTFLAMAAQQFRDVRNMERQMLSNVDQNELVPRGVTYIEGIAMVFEGRNYLAIFTAFVTSLATYFFNWYGGIAAGLAGIAISVRFMSGNVVGDIADIREGRLHFDGPNLYVDDIHIMNIGLEDSKQHILQQGIGIILTPKNANAKTTLAHLGQRQAIIHDVSTILGIYRDSGTPSFVPLSKRDLATGRLAFFLLPLERDMETAKFIISRSPVLENSIRKPLKSEAMKRLR